MGRLRRAWKTVKGKAIPTTKKLLLEGEYRKELARKLVRKLRRRRILMETWAYISFSEAFFMFLSAFFLYALIFGEANLPMILVTLLINFLSAITYFYNRSVEKSIFITIGGTITLALFVIIMVYVVRYPYFLSDIIRAINIAYNPLFSSTSKVLDLIKRIVGG